MVNINKYDEYILEKKIYDLMLESKLVFSDKFINMLSRINNEISNELIKYNSKDIDSLTQNYIDISDSNDKVSFITDRKSKEYLSNSKEYYRVINSQRYLTSSDRNNKIFDALGYDKVKYGCWAPNTGTIGEILGEKESSSDNIYVMFRGINENSDKIGVINKLALEESIDPEIENKLWNSSRSSIKVGRLIRSLLNSINYNFSDSEIENFVNSYKSSYDIMSNALLQFDVVKGIDIAYWYYYKRYVDGTSGGGTLNNSCMSEMYERTFEIYIENKQVSLIILYDDNGTIKDGKYTSSKIKGRALLWECKLNGSDIMFMDRVYTRFDSDVNLFIKYAEDNGYYYKEQQTMYPDENITNGKETVKGHLQGNLDNTDFYEYPYCDTLCYINSSNGYISNKSDDCDRELRSSEGEYSEIY
jgi:hypothetical protein